MFIEKRRDHRTMLRCPIRIEHPSLGSCLGHTRDLSESGVYVELPVPRRLRLGAVVTGQVQGLPVAGPALRMEVVRLDAKGVGLRFAR